MSFFDSVAEKLRWLTLYYFILEMEQVKIKVHANCHEQRVCNEQYFARKQKIIYSSALVLSVILLGLNTLQNVDRRFMR